MTGLQWKKKFKAIKVNQEDIGILLGLNPLTIFYQFNKTKGELKPEWNEKLQRIYNLFDKSKEPEEDGYSEFQC